MHAHPCVMAPSTVDVRAPVGSGGGAMRVDPSTTRRMDGGTTSNHTAAYAELVAARASKHGAAHSRVIRPSSGRSDAGGSVDGAPTPSHLRDSRKIRVPGAARDSSVPAPLAFNLRNAALVYSGVDIMALAGGMCSFIVYQCTSDCLLIVSLWVTWHPNIWSLSKYGQS